MRLIDADELITAFPCGESVRTESVRATINHMPTIEVSEDAISREWAINKQKELIELYTPHKTVEGRGQVYWQIEERKLVAKELEQAPSVIPSERPIEMHLDVTDDVIDRAVEQIRAESEDAISREDAVNALIAHFIPQTYTGEEVEQGTKLARKIMANAPSVVPKAKEGEWKITINQDYRCSNCNKITSSYKANYCPKCGAKMKGAEDE